MMDYKYEKHIINAKTLLSKKNLSHSELRMVEQELCIADYYNDFKKDYMLLNLYGKFYLAKGDLEKAKLYFNMAIDTGENDFPKASYYGLFKAYIKEENYIEAEKNLALYDSCFSDKFNMVFYFKCLNKIAQLNGQKIHKLDYFVNEKDYINCVKAPKEILDLYEKAEKFFDNGEYLKAYNTIQKAQNICNNKNYPLDFIPLLNMIYKVNVLYNKKDGINLVNQAIIDHLLTMENNEDKKKYLKEFTNDSKNVFAILKLIEILISEKNYSEAYLYLNHKMDAKETQRYIKELNEARKVVYEEHNHEKNKDKIEEYLIKAQEFISTGCYDMASKTYNEGYDKLQTPIFLFKLGELNYYLGNISLAKKYLVEYREKGKKYDIESCIYLGYIELIKNKNSVAQSYFEKFFENEDISKYLKVDEDAEKVYFDMVKDKTLPEFADKDLDFKNYCNEILNSIKNGKIYRIESINKNRHNPLDIAMVQIAAAPILYDMGETYLAEKYYQRAQIFIDDEIVCELSKQYEKKKNDKN